MVRLLCSLLCFSALLDTARAEEAGLPFTSEEAAELAAQFASCVGVYDWLSETYRTAEKPASAEFMNNMGNGAEIAAGWLLSLDHNSRNPEDQRTIGQMGHLVKPKAEAAKVWLAALAENDGAETIAAELRRCQAMAELQQSIADLVRDAMTKE